MKYLVILFMFVEIHTLVKAPCPPGFQERIIKCPTSNYYTVSLSRQRPNQDPTKALKGCSGKLKINRFQKLCITATEKFKPLTWQIMVKNVADVLIEWSDGFVRDQRLGFECEEWKTVTAKAIPNGMVNAVCFRFQTTPLCPRRKKMQLKDLIIKACQK